ncbi:flippase [Litoribacter ruber]|uniref:flippase n=1 Tax=Litoribacter ruber TaxID=702568 RepID=UPI001BDB1003|nr:flippase [Litoribacter ruber]MBT0812858.1 flippase [Litoribacter ruber]
MQFKFGDTFVKNISITLFRQIFSAILQLCSVVVLARILGPEGMGLYTLTILIPQFLISILNLGLPSSLVYYVANGSYTLKVSLYHTNKFLLFYLPLVLVVAGICLFFFSEQWFPELSSKLIFIGLLCLPFMLAQNVQISLLQALSDFKSFNLLTILQPLSFLLGVGVTALLGSVDVIAVLRLFLLSQILVSIATRGRVLKLVPQALEENFNDSTFEFLSKNLKYGLKAFFSNITAMINYRADLYLVGLLTNAASVGIYAIALQISERLFIISQAVSTVLLPKLSGLQEKKELQVQITNVVAKWSFLISILGGVSLFLLTKMLLVPFFGEDYLSSLQPLAVLVVAACFSSYSRVLSNAIAAKNKPEWNLYVGIITSVVNVGFNIWLIPNYGIMGAAYATLASFTLNFLLKILVYTGIFQINLKSLIDFSIEKKVIRSYMMKE